MKSKRKKSAQDIQDDIFRKMSADKKIKLTSQLTMLCLKLSRIDGNYKSRKTSSQNCSGS